MASDTWTENITPFHRDMGGHSHIAVANSSYGFGTGSAYDFCTGFADGCALHKNASGNIEHFRSFGFDPDNSVYVRMPDARNFPNGFIMALFNAYRHTGGGWDRTDQTVNHQVRLIPNDVADVTGGAVINPTNIICLLEAYDDTTAQGERRATTAFLIDNSTQAGTWWFGYNDGDNLVEHGKTIPS
tara:strand:+ start:296 stop:853 length:558 start_codon:yes stop_codon:yes gene_type:complete